MTCGSAATLTAQPLIADARAISRDEREKQTRELVLALPTHCSCNLSGYALAWQPVLDRQSRGLEREDVVERYHLPLSHHRDGLQCHVLAEFNDRSH